MKILKTLSIAILGLGLALSTYIISSQPIYAQTTACSTNGTIINPITFFNKSNRSIDIYWLDEQCQEVKYRTIKPRQVYIQKSYNTYHWVVRDSQNQWLLKQVMPPQTATTINIQNLTYRYPRATVDRSPDVFGYQIQAMYVLPSDGIDQKLDINGQIATSVAAFQQWFVGQTGKERLRLDTYEGALDITFVRLSETDAQIKKKGAFVRDYIQQLLKDRGYINNPQKIYAVYYGGGSTHSCGGGAWPPELVGQVAAVYLNGTPPKSSACNKNVLGTSVDTPKYWEFVMIHEIMHTLGFVGKKFTPSDSLLACSPNEHLGGHTLDSSSDLMYQGSLPWNVPNLVLDFGQDDYYKHNRSECLDLAKSVFLDPTPPDAEIPPGW
ncbi:hypothetical protein [Nostoc sp. FACHB-110]|uniref:hypothetical protein n=1 Tax=Nostoc sp. FACHB-110 TaxID=2692834 RepID=UPI0016873F2A|nr:hypothetical protein [Nostoc sp. FACHB-110]MBD2440463.1 hypothetical protein [Nostoc sp. FACHB-110]